MAASARDQRRIAVDRNRQRRAARQRLERQRAGAGVEIERRGARQVLAEPVEERLAHAVRRGTQAGGRDDGNLPAAMPAADDANQMGSRHER